MIKRLVLAIVVLAVIGIAVIAVLAWHSSIAPIEPKAASAFPADLVSSGEVLAAAGNCSSCHTTDGGEAYAGGRGLKTGFGTIYSSNITPDPDTGIGRWSEAAFARALREGIARDGSELYPAFPFDHFTKIRDEDVAALYAYFMTRKPVHAEAKPNELPFPLGIRALQAGWKLLFLDKGAYRDDPAKGADWNRGAYLVEGLAHCGACHTPRNALGAEKKDNRFAGATIEGWFAPAIDAEPTSPVPWTVDEFYAYLRIGGSAFHGSAAGTMSEVVHESLAKLPDADIRAISTYLADIAGTGAKPQSAAEAADRFLASARATPPPGDDGARLYAGACASCHYNASSPPLVQRPDLALNSAVNAPDPDNLVHLILGGVGRGEGLPNLYMPGFAHSFDDAEVAALADYLRASAGKPKWKDVDAAIARVRKGGKT